MSGPGKTVGDVDGWEVVICHGVKLVGKPCLGADACTILRPVYELKEAVVPGQGIPEAKRACYPIAWLASLRELAIPAFAIRIPIDSLDWSERASIREAVAKCEQGVRVIRAKQLGLVVEEKT